MDSPQFKESFKKLNAKQKEAVETIEGPVMVIAGPGTGKTTVLTLRIAQILKETDTPPSGILAITYTEAGVKAMKQKLREIIGGRADEVRIHTFHSFAVSVIRDYPDHFPHLSGTEPMTEIESRSFIEEILESKKFAELRPFGRPDLYIDSILKAISEAKKEANTPEMLKDYALTEIKRIENDDSLKSSRGATKGELKAVAKKKIQKCQRSILLSDIYQKYEEKKKKERKIDFDDMIFELKLALDRDLLLLRLIQEQFLYLLVDEHQDTNDSQNMLILMIAEFFDTPNVFIVGDEKQAIYRFQGASVENFLKFKKEWRDVKLIQLSTSYRSHQKILDASFNLIEHNYNEGEYDDLRVHLKSNGKKEEKPIVVIKGENINDTEEYLVRRIKEILKKEDEAEIALIVRTNAAVGRLKRLCESGGIQAISTRNVDIFEHPSGRLFFDLISALYNPLDRESLGKTVVAGLWGFSFDEQVEVLKEIRAGREIKKDDFSRKQKILRGNILSGDPLGFLFKVAGESGYMEKISSEPERIEIWRGIIELAEIILRSKNNPSDVNFLVEELLAYRELSEQKQVKIVSGDVLAKVKIMTAHGSKGLEFDYVFIPYATESFWMKKSRGSYFALPFEKTSAEDEIKDSRRLFYVALTRAKKHVEILAHTEMEGGEMDLTLRFIEELGEENVAMKTLKNIEKTLTLKDSLKNEGLGKNYILEAKRMLQERGLSVTALNHFLDCPNKFLYRSVLKIPDMPNINSEKGTAMHNALAAVFRLGEKNLNKIERIIRKKAFEHLDNSFLRKFEIEALKETLDKEIPLIVGSLKDHFSLSDISKDEPGSVSVEKAAAGELEIVVLGDKKINPVSGREGSERPSATNRIKVPIHGRLDLVVERKDGVQVFDYKTKKKMTEEAIRGENKGSNGEYLRQLIFYVLLVSQNPRYKDKNISSSLVFLTPDEKGRVKIVALSVSKEEINSLKEDIRKLAESVYSGEILNQTCSEPKCEWCALRKAVDI